MKCIATSVPGKVVVRSEKRYSVWPMASGTRWTAELSRSSGCAARTAEYRGMKAWTSCPSSRRLRTSAPATSASPPVFAYGSISELKTHSFNAGMTGSLTKASAAPREKVQAQVECGRLPLREIDILLALKGRGFLLQDGDVPPRGYCELH